VTRIADLLAEGPVRSVEFFPPKTPEGRVQLDATIDELASLGLSFVSVTYGAGGSTRDLTRDIVVGIESAQTYPAMPHLTCVGHSTGELSELLDDYLGHGIENILALAGDPPSDGSPAEGDFSYASELIQLIRSKGDTSIGVAAFPEGHPRSPTIAEDRRRLAEKLEMADFAITQFFFDADHYFRMVDDLAALGCDTPIIPGVQPLANPAAVRRFAEMNAATFPEELAAAVEAAEGGDRDRIVIDAATELSARLIEGGAPGLHFYCMNRAAITLGVLAQLG